MFSRAIVKLFYQSRVWKVRMKREGGVCAINLSASCCKLSVTQSNPDLSATSKSAEIGD